VEAELNEEVQYHVDRLIDQGLAAGLAPEEARRAALRAMGAIDKNKEECRDVRSGNLVGEFLGDLRYAARAFRRSPGFAALAIGIMALGIGANTAVFSVVHGVLLRPLPYRDADRIMTLRTTFLTTGTSQSLVAIANYRDWRDQSSSFEAMASYRPGEFPVTPDATAEYARTAAVDAQFFRVFGVEPIIGRTFTADETSPGAGRVVVLSHSFWQRRFGGDPRVLERTLRVGESPRSIVGVMPPGFQFPGETDVWGPQTTSSTSRTGHNLFAVGRLKPGVSLQQAQTELNAIAGRLEQQYPDSNRGRGVTAVRLQDDLVGDVRLTLYLLWGVVGVVLLIACANTATLLLGKAAARTREIAVRTALGAGRARIVRQLVTESLLLAVIAGASGVLLAYWGSQALVALSPVDVVRRAGATLDGGVLAFTLGVSLATSLLFGLVPSLQASKVDLIDAVRHGGARAAVSGGHSVRARGVLVVSEIALAVVLLTAAGLLIKTFVALHNADLGFQPSQVLVIKATGVRSLAENNAFFRALVTRIGALPGVTAVGATSIPPGDLSYAGTGSHFVDRIPGQRDRGREPATLMTVVAPGSFAALGIPLRSGRDFNDGDTSEGPRVAIVNEAVVRTSFGGANPIGRTIFCLFDGNEAMTVVGVAGDVRQRNPALPPQPECYMPYTQHAYNGATLNIVVRTGGEPLALTGTVRRLAAEISPNIPLAFTTMEERVSNGVNSPRFRAVLFAVFAGLALCLAMAGVYGVMAYAVERRSSEIGLRMALGASRGSVLRLILGEGAALAAAGLVLGLVGSAMATRVLTSVLFEVRPVDIQVYLAVAVLLSAITLLAGFFPARRATVVDPAQVLKAD
jgi:predicted permease